MNIIAELLKEHSKAQTLKIVNYIGNDKKRFEELIQIFLKGPYRITQRAAWVVSNCAESCPELIKPYLKNLIENLKRPVHNAVKRNTVRLLQFIDIPEYLLGDVANVCFELLTAKKEPIAVKVFSMTVLGNICKKEPELINELRILIEEQLPYASAGFTSRAKKILTTFKKNYS